MSIELIRSMETGCRWPVYLKIIIKVYIQNGCHTLGLLVILSSFLLEHDDLCTLVMLHYSCSYTHNILTVSVGLNHTHCTCQYSPKKGHPYKSEIIWASQQNLQKNQHNHFLVDCFKINNYMKINVRYQNVKKVHIIIIIIKQFEIIEFELIK